MFNVMYMSLYYELIKTHLEMKRAYSNISIENQRCQRTKIAHQATDNELKRCLNYIISTVILTKSIIYSTNY